MVGGIAFRKESLPRFPLLSRIYNAQLLRIKLCHKTRIFLTSILNYAPRLILGHSYHTIASTIFKNKKEKPRLTFAKRGGNLSGYLKEAISSSLSVKWSGISSPLDISEARRKS